MKRVNVNRVIEDLDLHSFGQKGWMRSKSCECPQCNRSDKFGVKLSNRGGVVHCFYDDFSEPLFKYLERIGREDLLDEDGSVSIDFKINSLSESETKENKSIDEKSLPMGFEETRNDEYLNSRNFLFQHYELFHPGYSSDPLLKNCIVFQFFLGEKRVGYQARSKYSKEWHIENLEKVKLGRAGLKLRYKDCPGMETSEILGGFNDLTDQTEVLILVEGLFDKTGVDKKLELYSSLEMRCCFTFGSSIGQGQINLIKLFSSIRRIYLLYDQGTMSQVKRFAMELSKCYQVYAAIMPGEEDPGDASRDVLLTTLENSISAIDFYSKRIETKVL